MAKKSSKQQKQRTQRLHIAILASAVILVCGMLGAALFAVSADATPAPIKSSLGNKCLDVYKNERKNGAKVQIWDCNGKVQQKWSLRSDGTVRVNGASFCLAVKQTSTKVTATVHLYKCDNKPAQIWQYDQTAKRLVNPNSNLCLGVKDGNKANGTPVWLMTCDNEAAQLWTPQQAVVPTTPTPTPPTPTPPTPTPTTPTPPTPTPTPPTGGTTTLNGPTGTWKMVFGDEFNGATLDTKKWQMCNSSFPNPKQAGGDLCRTSYNGEQQYFRVTPNNKNVQVNNGQLHLITTRENGRIYSGMVGTGPDVQGGGNQTFDANGKLVNSTYKLGETYGYKPTGFTYGFVEWRAKFPKGNGFWPSFWMLPMQQKQNGAWPNAGEYDIMEIPGNNPSQHVMTKHDDQASGGAPAQAKPPLGMTKYGFDSSTGFHTYALEWAPKTLKWYLDGKLEFQITNNNYIKNYPFYIMANLSVGGKDSWGGPGGPLHGGIDGTTPFPAEFTIDYVRVYQRP